MFCMGEPTLTYGLVSETQKFLKFKVKPRGEDEAFMLCGKHHEPRASFAAPTAQYYYNKIDRYSSFNFRSNFTSNRFLCNKMNWTQGNLVVFIGII